MLLGKYDYVGERKSKVRKEKKEKIKNRWWSDTVEKALITIGANKVV